MAEGKVQRRNREDHREPRQRAERVKALVGPGGMLSERRARLGTIQQDPWLDGFPHGVQL